MKNYCWECKIIKSLWKIIWRFLWKLNGLIIPSSNCTLDTYLRTIKTYSHKKILYMNVHSNHICNSLKTTGKKSDVLQQVNGKTNSDVSIVWNIIQQLERLNYWYRQDIGWPSRNYADCKRPISKKICTVWFNVIFIKIT